MPAYLCHWSIFSSCAIFMDGWNLIESDTIYDPTPAMGTRTTRPETIRWKANFRFCQFTSIGISQFKRIFSRSDQTHNECSQNNKMMKNGQWIETVKKGGGEMWVNKVICSQCKRKNEPVDRYSNITMLNCVRIKNWIRLKHAISEMENPIESFVFLGKWWILLFALFASASRRLIKKMFLVFMFCLSRISSYNSII